MSQLVVGVPPAILQLVQEGLIERAFYDGLFPALLFRAEAQYEEWPANSGTEIFMTRPGLMTPRTKPLLPGHDPEPQTVSYEQWVARLARYADTIDTHMPTSAVASSDQFVRNIHQLGLQSGQSLNRIPRNALFQAYQSGHTVTIASGASGDNTIRVASLNGFTDVVTKGSNVRPSPVSSTTPLAISITGVTGTRNVIGFSADDPDDPLGPGTLFLSATLGAAVASRAPVLSVARPRIHRCGGGASIDAIGLSDVFQLQDAIVCANFLRKQNVPPHEDGYYHAHISTEGNTQVFTDQVMAKLNQGNYDGPYYQEGFLGTFSGIAFFLNNEAPDSTNTGRQTSTGTNATYAEDIGAETINESGVRVGRILVTGRACIYERGLDESAYVTEAGVTGKIGEFQIVNSGVDVMTERIRLILRAPMNRLQDVVSATWSITTSFPIPSDVTSGGPERFKRAVVIEHALE